MADASPELGGGASGDSDGSPAPRAGNGAPAPRASPAGSSAGRSAARRPALRAARGALRAAPAAPPPPESMQHGGSFGRYMELKNLKLREQFDADALAAGGGGAGGCAPASRLFAGVSIHVNGFTQPPADELRRLMLAHGGRCARPACRARPRLPRLLQHRSHTRPASLPPHPLKL